MKTLFVFLLGIAIGAVAIYYYRQQPRGTAANTTPSVTSGNVTVAARDAADRAAAKTREVAADVSAALREKMREWNLTPENIKSELARGGEVARQKTARVREQVGDVAIVAAIKGKFVLDRDLSARSIAVESKDGRVTLTGTVPSEDAVAKAVALALDTEGVHHVSSTLKVTTAH